MVIKAGVERPRLGTKNKKRQRIVTLLVRNGFPQLFAPGRAEQIIANEERGRRVNKSGG